MISGQCRIPEPYLGFSSLLVLSRQLPLYVRNKIKQTNKQSTNNQERGGGRRREKDVTRVEKSRTTATRYYNHWGGLPQLLLRQTFDHLAFLVPSLQQFLGRGKAGLEGFWPLCCYQPLLPFYIKRVNTFVVWFKENRYRLFASTVCFPSTKSPCLINHEYLIISLFQYRQSLPNFPLPLLEHSFSLSLSGWEF